MKDLGPLHYFLGLSVTHSKDGMFLSQAQYAPGILRRANMVDCNLCRTPIESKGKLSAASGPPVSDPTLCRSLAGALQYLTFNRPDISYAVQQVCLFMYDPRQPHMAAVKRILRYLKGTINHGLHLQPSPSFELTAYSDAD